MIDSLNDYVCNTELTYDYDNNSEEITEMINLLAEEYEKSPEAEDLESAMSTAQFFCEMLFSYEGLTIADCTFSSLVETVENTIPRKMTMREKAEAKLFITELIQFWKFLKRAYSHPKADEFGKYLESVQTDFVDWMFDPSKAGMAKGMFMDIPGGMPNFESKEDLERFLQAQMLQNQMSQSHLIPSSRPSLLQFPSVRETPKIGRNDLCPCGSGKKFKKCCGGK